jgi:subtilisin-like proprotein convertase family protein
LILSEVAVIKTGDPGNPAPALTYTVTIDPGDTGTPNVEVVTRGPNVVQAANTAAGATANVTGESPTWTITLTDIKGDGYIQLKISGLSDADGNEYEDTVTPEFRVDGTRPEVRITPDPNNPTQASPPDPLTGVLTYFVEFVDESATITDFDSQDILVNGALWPNARVLSAQFPSGKSCRGPGVKVLPAQPATAKVYTVLVYPRGDGPVSISVPEDAAADDVGWTNTASNEASVEFTDAPRVNIERQGPANTNASTINFKFEFSKRVSGFGTGDVSVEPVATKGAAGGTKTAIVTGSGAPGDPGQVFNVAVSGMTYSGFVKVSLAALVTQPGNWESEEACSSPQVNYDGQLPDYLNVLMPSPLPQPPAYSSTYTTSNGMLDIAGTAHDDVAIDSVTWSNNRGGSGSCSISNIAASIVGPSITSTAGDDVTYTVRYLNADSVKLNASHITLHRTGTADGTVSVSGSGNVDRTVTISGITGSGTLSISVAAGTASSGGAKAPAVGPSVPVSVGTAGPSVSIGVPSTALYEAGDDPVDFTVNYANATGVELKPEHITLHTTGTAEVGSVTVSVSGDATRKVTLSGITGNGTIGISVASGTATPVGGGTMPGAGPSAVFDVGTARKGWTATGIRLKPGENVITISARDAAGNVLTHTLTVTCSNPFWADTVQSPPDQGDLGQHTSIALDASRNPRISYYESLGEAGTPSRNLRYAAWNGAGWSITTVDGIAGPNGSENADIGEYTSLKLDGSGNPRIAYYDATNTNLKYAYFQNGQWVCQTVDGTTGRDDMVGKYSSLALDPTTAYPRIAYYDETNKRLKYAEWNGTSWQKVVVDASADVGAFASLALDANGNPSIAYYDATNKSLKYARRSETTWSSVEVDKAGNVGQYASLALDSTGNPHVAYYDADTESLKYAKYNGAAWSVSVVDTPSVGQYASIAMSPTTGQPRIAYYDALNGDLKLASYDGTEWSKTILDDGKAESGVNIDNVGQYCSLALDSNGLPHASYYDVTHKSLKYVFGASGPNCTVTGPASPTNSSPMNFTITFSSAVTGLQLDEIVVTGGTKNSLTPGPTVSTTTYTLSVTPTASTPSSNTTVTCRVPSGVARASTLDNLASNTATVIYDGTRPTVTINQEYGQTDPANVSPVFFTVVFSEPVTGFSGSSVAISGSAGGTKTVSFTGGGTHYQIAVTGMTTAGTVIASVPAGVVQDAAGNTNLASTSTDTTVWFDDISPGCSVGLAAGQNPTTKNSPINFAVTFTEPVIGFAGTYDRNNNIGGKVTIGGEASFTGPDGLSTAAAVITPTGTPDAFGHFRTYNVAVSGMQNRGSVTLSIPAGAAQDCDRNGVGINTSTQSTNQAMAIFDSTPPTVTIDQKAEQPDPTAVQPIRYTVIFSKPVTGFTGSDVVLSGTADTSGAVVNVTGSGATYTVEVSGVQLRTNITEPQTVIATIPAGAAVDSAGNGNLQATSDDNTVWFDNRGPRITVEQAAGQADSTRTGPVNFTVTFSEPVTGFDKPDKFGKYKVKVDGTVGYISPEPEVTPEPKVTVTDISGNQGRVFNVAVDGFKDDSPGNVVLSVAENVLTDALGNPNSKSTSTDNSVVFLPEQCSKDTPVPIPDNDAAGVESTIDLSYISGTITDVNVKLSISHDRDQDIVATLVDPDNKEIPLFTNVGRTGVNFTGTVLDDEAVQTLPKDTNQGAPFTGSWRPEGQLSNLDGKNIAGVWKLRVADTGAGHTGSLLGWCLQLTVADIVPPSCKITGVSKGAVGLAEVEFTIEFSEPPLGFTVDDIAVTGGTKGSLIRESGTTYKLTVYPSAPGVVKCAIGAKKYHDTCGNYNDTEASGQATYNTPASVTINQAGGQSDPTATSPIRFAVVFSEPVTGFTAGDVTVAGTAFGLGATPVVAVSGSGASYTVSVSGMTQSGTVTATVPAGVANDVDFPDNGNLASTSTDNTVTFDITRPTVTINQAVGQSDPTTASSMNFSVVFSKAVTGFTSGDVVVTGTAGGTKTVTVTGSGATYTVTVALSGSPTSGSVIVSIPANAAVDALGNQSESSTSTDNTVWFDDGLPPTVTVNQADGQADPTSTSPVVFSVVFNKPVNDFDNTDVTVTTDSADTLTVEVTPLDEANYTVSISGMTEPQTISVSIEPDKVHDSYGNGNSASTSTDNEITFDNEGPDVEINQAAGQADPTASPVIKFTVVFSEPVFGFSSEDVQVGGTAFGPGAAPSVGVTQTGATSYNVTVSGMTVSGDVVATIPAGAVQDAAGNANNTSTSVDNKVEYDTPPTVVVERAPGQLNPTNGSTINFRVTFSEPVVGFATGDVSVTGTAFGAGSSPLGTVSGSGNVYNVAVTGMTRTGVVAVSIPANVAVDLNGYGNVQSAEALLVQYDITPPTVTVNQTAGQADPVSAGPLSFTIVFSEPVTGFTASAVTITGTAGGTKTVTVNGSGTTYTALVSGMTSSGTVIASVAAGKAYDAAGNGNTASTSTDNTITFDVTGPTVTVNQASGQADPTGAAPINFTIVFSKPVTGFTGDDVTIGGTAGGTKTVTVTGSGTTYNAAVSGMTSSGTVTATVAANRAHDSLGNGNSASTSTDNTVFFDNAVPTVTIDQASGQADPTNHGPIHFTVVFSKDVTGFAAGDVVIGGTTGATTATVTGSGKNYDVAVSGMTASGTLTVTIPAGAAHDVAGNANAASTSTDNTVTYDDTPPTVSITDPTSEAACTRNCTSLPISGSAEDAVGIAKVEWSTGRGASGTCTGTTAWHAAGIAITGGEDTVTITATDTAGNKSTDTLAVRVIDASPGSAWNGLAMVGLPIIPDETDPKIAVGFTGNYWAMYKPAVNDYVQYPGAETWFNPAEATPGRGFWTAFSGNAGTPCGVVPAQDQPVTIKLGAGWNLIGQPFIAPLTWDLTAIKVKYGSSTRTLAEARDLGWIRDYAWGWRPDPTSAARGAYYLVCDPAVIAGATPEMAPWQAYWIKTTVACDLILPAP